MHHQNIVLGFPPLVITNVNPNYNSQIIVGVEDTLHKMDCSQKIQPTLQIGKAAIEVCQYPPYSNPPRYIHLQ
jgi:hypothetical protein